MIDINLTDLVEHLDPASRNALAGAAGECVARGHYEMTIEHALLLMIEQPDDELRAILAAYEISPELLRHCLLEGLEALMQGHTGRPVFSPLLIEWLMEAWLICSIEKRRSTISSTALWTALAARSDRYVNSATARFLKQNGLTSLRKRFDEFAAASTNGNIPGSTDAARADAGGPLAQFCVNFSAEARAGKIDPVLERDAEIRQIIDILGRRRKNNPIVVGEPGVGKTALIEGLALKIAAGTAPEFLRNVEIMGLDLGLLQAGARVRGEFEKRLKEVIAAVEDLSRPVILFFDEAHMLIGAGGAPGGADAANLLKPALARGNFRAIAATTWKEYKKYFEKDPALSRRFQLVKLDTPSPAEAVTILRGLRERFEETHALFIRDEAIEAAVELSSRYMTGGQLPDKAIDVLDTTAARVRISRSSEPPEIERLSARISALRRAEVALSRDHAAGGFAGEEPRLAETRTSIRSLEEELAALTDRWNDEKVLVEQIVQCVAFQADATERANPQPEAGPPPAPLLLREETKIHSPDHHNDTLASAETTAIESNSLTELRARLAEVQAGTPLVHFEVTADAVARTVSEWTGVPLGAMARNEANAALSFADNLSARVCGQPQAIDILDRELSIARAGVADPDKPRGVFLLVGPSGVGKTETAVAIAEILFGGRRQMTVINMSEYQEKHTVSRLFGAPPGYVGYGEGGVLTEAVRQKPYSIVLLDEAEKAHPEVLNTFYQVFDKGTMADGEGRDIDFRNTIILLTSNLGADQIADMMARQTPPDAADMTEELHPTLSRHFKPALLARLRVVPYVPLGTDTLRTIVAQRLQRLGERLCTQPGLTLDYSDAVLDHITAHCVRHDGGARNIDAMINQTLLPRISTEILAAMNQDRHLREVIVAVEEGEFSYDFS